jgi:hypothetical protein
LAPVRTVSNFNDGLVVGSVLSQTMHANCCRSATSPRMTFTSHIGTSQGWDRFACIRVVRECVPPQNKWTRKSPYRVSIVAVQGLFAGSNAASAKAEGTAFLSAAKCRHPHVDLPQIGRSAGGGRNPGTRKLQACGARACRKRPRTGQPFPTGTAHRSASARSLDVQKNAGLVTQSRRKQRQSSRSERRSKS